MGNASVCEPVFVQRVRQALDEKTKPLGSLGRLEALAEQLAVLQQRLDPVADRCTLLLFAADHGLVEDGVSAYPQEVTRQMVLNFLSGGAAANVLARSVGADVCVVDAGVAGPPIEHASLVCCSMGAGTQNSRVGPAMTLAVFEKALLAGEDLATNHDAPVIALGEMGIGNTSAASLVAHKILGVPLERMIGRGTGLDDDGLMRKMGVLQVAASRTESCLEPFEALCNYGGFEMVMMAGALRGAAKRGAMVLVDGFIASVAAMAMLRAEPEWSKACVFSHLSVEQGHAYVLESLGVKPLLQLDMRLGEGTGALLAYPLVKAAAAMLCDMASFQQAGVSEAHASAHEAVHVA